MNEMLYELIDAALPPARVHQIRVVLLTLALLACVGCATALAVNMVSAAIHHHPVATTHQAGAKARKVK